MRMVEVVKDFSRNGFKFQKSHRYVMAEDAESQFRSVAGDQLGMSYPIEQIYRPYKGEDLSGKTIMSWRTGGIGDIMFISPVFRYLKNKYKGCTIKFASACKQPIENNPNVDELYNLPFDAALLESADYHLMFQGIIEAGSDLSKRTHAVDMFFKYFSIDSIQLPPEIKRPQLYYTQEEINWMNETYKKLGVGTKDYVIGIQLETSAPLRNFPKDKMKVIIDVLAKEPRVKILLIGSSAQTGIANFYKGNYQNVKPAVNYSVRQSLILAKRYNLVISPDSFMIQAAGALETPLIGLYGPFPSEVRMKYFKNAIGIEPDVICSPCYKHDFRACIKGFPSPCFSLVKAEDVLQASDFHKHKTTGQHFNFMSHFLATPDFSTIEQYFLSADKGLCFFPGYFRHPNMIRVDTNRFVQPDINDLSTEFKRGFYPFVLYMNEFEKGKISVYEGSKTMVRPGGYFIVYKRDSSEQFFNELKQDIGKVFILLYSKYDPSKKTALLVGKRKY